MRPGFRLIIFIKDNISLIPRNHRSIKDTNLYKHAQIINWSPFGIGRTFHQQLTYTILAPGITPGLLTRRRELL